MKIDNSTKDRIWRNAMWHGPMENLPQEGPYTGWPNRYIYQAAILVVGYLELGGSEKLGRDADYFVCGKLKEIDKEITQLYDSHKITEATRDTLLKRLKYLKDATGCYYSIYSQ